MGQGRARPCHSPSGAISSMHTYILLVKVYWLILYIVWVWLYCIDGWMITVQISTFPKPVKWVNNPRCFMDIYVLSKHPFDGKIYLTISKSDELRSDHHTHIWTYRHLFTMVKILYFKNEDSFKSFRTAHAPWRGAPRQVQTVGSGENLLRYQGTEGFNEILCDTFWLRGKEGR